VLPDGSTVIPGNPQGRIRPDGTVIHVVAAGDTVIGIATRYDLTVDGFYEVSGLDENSVLQPGQEIVVGHQPRPQEVGGSTNLPGELESATPTALPTETAAATPLPPTATSTAVPEALAAITETPSAKPTNALAANDNGRSPAPSPGLNVRTIAPLILGLIGVLALGGAALLFTNRK
jgi:LysM repeat protein